MDRKQDQVRIIFPDYKDFWSELSGDETSHAKCIRELTSKIEQGLVYFNEERFQPAAIARSLQYIEQMQERALQPDFSLINALSIASFIEDALIENEYFEVFEGDSAELQEVLHILASATNEHWDRVHKALAEMKLQTD
jgi:c-di-GMP-related signal transduction protein